MRRTIALLLALLLLCGMAACSSRETPVELPEETEKPVATPTPTVKPTEPPATPSPEPTPEATPEPTPTPEPEPAFRDLFNGAGRDEPNTGRPFAVMINNIKQAQPQCGIENADIIYEVLAEGGVTRMMAIFSDVRKAEHLGSIRSIRPYYIDISLAYGAVTCHAGGSEDAYSRIRHDGIDDIDGVRGSYPMEVFYRDQQRKYSGYAVEHTLFTEGESLYNCAEKLGFDLNLPEGYDNGLRFCEDGTPDGGSAAEKIAIAFNSGKSTGLSYHADSGLYTATQHGGDYSDGNTGKALSFRNVLCLWAPTKVLDNYGRLQIGLIGSGEGYFACGGQYVKLNWSRASVEDCYHYTLADGSELQLGEGATYIAVLSQGMSEINFE